jgi:hypothetical protein
LISDPNAAIITMHRLSVLLRQLNGPLAPVPGIPNDDSRALKVLNALVIVAFAIGAVGICRSKVKSGVRQRLFSFAEPFVATAILTSASLAYVRVKASMASRIDRLDREMESQLAIQNIIAFVTQNGYNGEKTEADFPEILEGLRCSIQLNLERVDALVSRLRIDADLPELAHKISVETLLPAVDSGISVSDIEFSRP